MPSIDISRHQSKKKTAKKPAGDSLMTLLNKDIRLGKKELSDKKKEQFYLELNSLLRAGIDLRNSLELITAEQVKQQDKAMFEEIQRRVIAGTSFSAALAQTKKFSTYEIFSLQIGEETGKLTEVLQDMAKYYHHKTQQRRKIVSALTYPCIVLTSSLGAVFFMLKFIVPMFADVFKRFGGHLPWLTERIMALSQALTQHFLSACLVLVILAVLFIVFRKKPYFRKTAASLLLKIPVIGSLIQKIYLARFCNAMRLLISARLPLLRTIGLIRVMIRFYPLETSLQQVEKDILQGIPLHQSLQQFPIYPSKMIQLIKIGEETNQLDYFFAKVSEQYLEEVEYQTAALSSMMEPLIIVFLGLVVGLILISMYLPLFEMSNNFN